MYSLVRNRLTCVQGAPRGPGEQAQQTCPRPALGPCAKIAAVQDDSAERQVPEPWNGDLARAPILFVSSNPSISEVEVYPTDRWIDDAIVAFFGHP